ncbi:hypothetical protein [Ornithinimicrobium pratense]|uniref:Uncharacterized protein n=1 Tax=Ornithinimicrobium pratense TaxID=2593973 RepID=A0A5J6V1S4_9MICO|nr:hypothetical protein [Ornithinimicrobium pratense]QFG67567.1 hypothetical protein FY030_01440 [Ornithinimicrobium pratense]
MSRERHEGPLTGVLQAYRDARGVAQDQAWAEQVVGTLVLDEVSPGLIRRELQDALNLVRESGEGPEVLYGPAREWARERVVDRAEQGLPTVDSTPDSTWRDVLVVGSVVASLISLMILVVWLVRDGFSTDYTWGLLLLPLVAGTGVMGALTTWERVLTRRPAWMAAAAGLGVAALTVALLAWLLLGTRDDVLATGSTFSLGLLAIGYALLAGALERLLPERGHRRRPPLDDEAWARELAGTLRLRMNLPETKVREIVREARSHAAQSGQDLAQEFGTPATYASRFARDRATRARRAAWLQTALVPLAALVAFGGLLEEPTPSGISGYGLMMVAVTLTLAVQGWRRVRRATDDPQGPGGSGTPVGTGR